MTDRSSTQQTRQCCEQHDGCVDEENDMGYQHPSSQPIKESDSSQCIYYTTQPSKRFAFVYPLSVSHTKNITTSWIC